MTDGCMTFRRLTTSGPCRIIVLLMGLFLLMSVAVPAQDLQDKPESDPVKEEVIPLEQRNFGPVIFRTMVSLILLVGLIYAAMFFLRRFVNRRRGSGGLSIRILGSTFLGPKKGIYLVEVEGRRLLLGVTDGAISYLTELEKGADEEVSDVTPQATGETEGGRFRDILNTWMGKRGKDE